MKLIKERLILIPENSRLTSHINSSKYQTFYFYNNYNTKGLLTANTISETKLFVKILKQLPAINYCHNIVLVLDKSLNISGN